MLGRFAVAFSDFRQRPTSRLGRHAVIPIHVCARSSLGQLRMGFAGRPGWSHTSVRLVCPFRSSGNSEGKAQREMAMASMTEQSVISAAGQSARGGLTTSPVAGQATAQRHIAWLAGGIAMSFLVPFVLADQLELQRDIYYGIYSAAVVALFVQWSRDTGQSIREMCARHWQWAAVLGVAFAGLSALIVLIAEDATSHPGGLEFVAAIGWRGLVYGAADGLLLSAFPILVVFAAFKNSRLRRGRGGLVAVGAVAMAASLAITATYHLGYSDFRSSKLRKPVTGGLVWSVPTLATLNPIGAPLAHAGLHVAAVTHSYDTDLFLPPH